MFVLILINIISQQYLIHLKRVYDKIKDVFDIIDGVSVVMLEMRYMKNDWPQTLNI